MEEKLKDKIWYALEKNHLVCIVDKAGNINYANDKFVQLSKYTKEEIKGLTFFELWDSELYSKDFFKTIFNESSKAGKWEGELKCIAKNKKSYCLDIVVSPFSNQELIFICNDITKRKKKETHKKARKQEAKLFEDKLKAIFDSPLMGIVITQPNKKLIECNQKFLDLLGYTKEELSKTHWTEINHPEDLDKDTDLMAKLVKGEIERYIFEKRYIRKDKSEIYVEIYLEAVRKESGEINYLIALVKDIHLNKLAEIKLKESEAKFSKIFYSSPLYVLISKLSDGTFLEVNNATLDKFGYKREEMIGKRSLDLKIVSPEDRNKAVKELQEKGNFKNLEATYYTRQGEAITGLASGELIQINGEWCIIQSINDITERKKAEEKIIENQAYLQNISESLKGLVFYQMTFKQNGTFFYNFISDNFESIYGFKTTELFENPNLLYEHLHPEDRLGIRKAEKKSILERSVFQEEVRHFNALGKIVWMQIRAVPSLQKNGDIVYYGVSIDISKEKLATEIARESEVRLQTISDGLKNLVFYQYISRKEGAPYYPFLSQNFEYVYNLKREQVHENSAIIYNYIHPDDLPMLNEAGKKTLEELTPYHVVFRYFRNENEIIWIEVRASPTRLLNGDTVFNCVSMDVTERKMAEEKIRESEIRLQTISDSFKGLVFYQIILNQDLNFYFTYISVNFESVFGFKVELLEKNPGYVYKAIHPEDLPKVREVEAKARRDYQPYQVSYRIFKKNNQIAWIQSIVALNLQANGDIVFNCVAMDITKEKLAEEKIKESEIRLQSINDGLPEVGIYQIIFNKDAIPQFTYLSANAEKILGLKAEAIFRNANLVYERSHPEDLEKVKKAEVESIKNLSMLNVEIRHFKTKNRLIWLQLSSIPTLMPNGDISINGVIIDISKRKMAEEKIRESETRLKTISDSLKGFVIYQYVFSKTKPLKCSYISAESLKLFGYLSQDFYKDANLYYTLIHPEDKEKFTEARNQSIKNLGILDVEIRHLRNKKEIVWTQIKAIPVLLENGDILYNGVSIDITERKKAEEIIRQNEIRLQSINDGLPEVGIYQIVLSKDLIPRFTYLSANAEKIFNLKAEKIFKDANLIYGRIHPEDMPKLRETEQKTERDTSFFNIELRYFKSKNKIVWLQLSSISLEMPNGELSFNGVVIDITHRKIAEEKIKKALEKEQKLNEELAAREEELSSSEEELRQINQTLSKSNEELMKLNTELDRFVYSASHDLRAPIASVLGLITLCRMTDDKEEINKYLGLQESSIKRLDNFIRDILDYSRNTRLEVEKEEINFQEMLEEIFEQYNYLENADKIKKTIKVNQQEKFYSDARRLSVVFNNLISNAIRYTNPYQDEPFIEVIITVNKNTARVQIKDNGQGIGKEHLEKIFEMFYRATEKKSGSGLGLYIVKETIEKLKGWIKAESESGKWTKITFEISNLEK